MSLSVCTCIGLCGCGGAVASLILLNLYNKKKTVTENKKELHYVILQKIVYKQGIIISTKYRI